MAGSSPSLPDGSNPSAAIVQSASDVQCSRLLKTTDEQIAELKRRVAAGEQKALIARDFGISRETLYQYLRES